MLKRSGLVARQPMPAWLRTAIAVVCWLLVWELVARLVGHEVLLVSPVQAAVRLVQLLPTAGFWSAVGFTLGRIGLGFVAAFVVGFALAVVANLGPWPAALIGLPIRVIRAVPVVSVIILILIWANARSLPTVVSALMVLPVAYANAAEGLAQRDPQLAELAQVFDVPVARRWWAITLPQLLPYLTASVRVGMGLAWKAGVSAEVIGLTQGSIGQRLYQAKLFLSTADLFAWTAVVIVAAILCEHVALWLLGGMRHWLGTRYAR
jgi:NitT/TauT family transport system permease protein